MKDLVYSFNASQGHKAFPPKYTNPHNYRFDEIGNLVHDSIEEIDTINWMVTGKIKSIIRKASSTKDNLYFDYDAQGNRIAKHNYTSANVWKHSTYYVRDAQGNVMSVYDKKPVTPFMSYKLSEQHIYGSSRLGMTNPGLEMIGATASIDTVRMYLGFKHYELSNHLGNVLTTISDKKIQIGYTGCPMSLDFNSGNTTGMQTDNALLSTATQSLEVTPLSAFAGVNAVFTSTPGVTYNIQFTFNNNTTNATDGFVITAYDFDGTTYSNITNLQIGLPANGVNSYTYTAGPSTSFVKFYYTSGLNVPTHSFYIDDLSICSPSSTPTPTVVDHFIADISSATDYYAFGQEQWGRKYMSRSSVDGFNSKRKDDDIKGDGNSYDYGARMYDPRLGRFMSIDPLTSRFAWFSPYQFAGNNPIWANDLDGLEVDKCFNPNAAHKGPGPPSSIFHIGPIRLPVRVVTTHEIQPPMEIHGKDVAKVNEDYVQQFDVPKSSQAKVEFEAYSIPDAIVIYDTKTGAIVATSDGEMKGHKDFVIPKGIKQIKIEIHANKESKEPPPADDTEGEGGTPKKSQSAYNVSVVSTTQNEKITQDTYFLGIRIKHKESNIKVKDKTPGKVVDDKKEKVKIKQLIR